MHVLGNGAQIPLFVLWFQFWISFSIFWALVFSPRVKYKHIVYFAVAIKWLCGKCVTHIRRFVHTTLALCVCEYVRHVWDSIFFCFLPFLSLNPAEMDIKCDWRGQPRKKRAIATFTKKKKKKKQEFLYLTHSNERNWVKTSLRQTKWNGWTVIDLCPIFAIQLDATEPNAFPYNNATTKIRFHSQAICEHFEFAPSLSFHWNGETVSLELRTKRKNKTHER